MEHIHLARSWRCRTFDQMIGQAVSIRILKNSLYRNYFVPVYLFAGLKGSGKTTLARIFASAINCERLPEFQQDPKKNALPCLECSSCMHAVRGAHPDILEIDAASHTGVDHVRTLIDAAGLLPVLGRKRVYIIDEAHMLSKAAFNAFLKILEEPPASVLFIMATTELTKILETVRSRSLQLFFTPIDSVELTAHLQKVCEAEKIPYELEALKRLAHEAHGSARDALNMLERVRLADEQVTLETVNQALNLVSQSRVIELLSAIIQKQEVLAIKLLNEYATEEQRVLAMWRTIGNLLTAVLTELYTQEKDILPLLAMPENVNFNAKECTRLLHIWLEYDQILLKGVSPLSVVQLALLNMMSAAGAQQSSKQIAQPLTERVVKKTSVSTTEPVNNQQKSAEPPMAEAVEPQWQNFLNAVEQLNDPLLNSIFNQVRKRIVEQSGEQIQLHFSQDLSFFTDWLQSTQQTWQPLLNKAYGLPVRAIFHFDQPVSAMAQGQSVSAVAPQRTQSISAARPQVQSQQQRSTSQAYEVKKKAVARKTYGTVLRIADAAQWPRASVLNQIFPGTIYIESCV